MIKKVFVFLVSLIIVTQGSVSFTSALSYVTVSGIATISSGTPTNLDVCFYPSDGTGTKNCVDTDGSGAYSVTLRDDISYNVDLEGSDGSLTFVSSLIRIAQPQTATLDLTLKPFTVVATNGYDIFGTPINNVSLSLQASGQIAGADPDSISYSSTMSITSNGAGYSNSLDTSTSNSSGTAVLRKLANLFGNISALPPGGSNLNGISFFGNGSPIDYTLYPNNIPVTPSNQQANTSPSFSWTTVANANHYDIYRTTGASILDHNVVGQYIGSTASLSFTDSSALSDGLYFYTIVAIENSTSAVIGAGKSTVTVDKTAPVLSGLSMSKTSLNSHSGPVTVTVANFSDNNGLQSAEFYIDNAPIYGSGIPLTIGSNLSTSYTFSDLSKGTHTLYVRAKDLAGNISNTLSVQFSWK